MQFMIFFNSFQSYFAGTYKEWTYRSNPQNAIMFLCTLNVVVVSLAVASSNGQPGQREETGIGGSRERYNVPQEIRDRVPIDFAARIIREFRLKYQSNKNILPYDRSVEETSKSSIVKRISSSKNPSEETEGNANSHDAVLGSRKRSNKNGFVVYKKTSGSRGNSFQIDTTTRSPTIARRREKILRSNNSKQGNSRSRTQSTMRSNALKRKSVNSFDDIKKAINALPQEMVKVVRDDIDCIDDPATKLHDTRGPPCTFSARWPGSGGDPWLWLNNVVPQNWELFHN